MSLNTESTSAVDSTVPTLGKHILLAVGVAGVAVSSLMIVVVIRMRGQMRSIMNQERPLSEITIEDNFSDHCRVGPITPATKLFGPSDYQSPTSTSLSLHITKNPTTCMQNGEISPDDTTPLSLPLQYSQQQDNREYTPSTDESMYHKRPRDRKISNKSTSSFARWSKWFRKSESSDDFHSQASSQDSIFNVDYDVQPVMKECMTGSATLISYQAAHDIESQYQSRDESRKPRPVSTASKYAQRHGPSKLRLSLGLRESVPSQHYASQAPTAIQRTPRPRSSKISVSLRKKVLKKRLGSVPQVVPESTVSKHQSFTCEISFSAEESPISVLKELSQATTPLSTKVNEWSTGSTGSMGLANSHS